MTQTFSVQPNPSAFLQGKGHDLIVIGGGFGGLAAAIRLQAAGQHVTLVEARERLGGRAFSTQRGWLHL